jgi:hypothetical protein
LSVNFSKSKIVSPKRLNFPTNSESIVWGQTQWSKCQKYFYVTHW